MGVGAGSMIHGLELAALKEIALNGFKLHPDLEAVYMQSRVIFCSRLRYISVHANMCAYG